MCVMKAPKSVAAARVAADDNQEALASADAEARRRRRQAGAAANILTSATGVRSTGKLGGVAA